MRKSLNEIKLRRLIQKIIQEEADIVPGDAPGNKQVHLFDFDDTLGVTTNANAIMLYQDGAPVHKTEKDAREWMRSKGLSDSDLLDPGIVAIPERDNAYAIYVSSSGLAKVQSKYDKSDQKVTGYSEPDKGEQILIDFTPSSNTDVETTKPIDQTIEKLKAANSAGAKTAVVTARTAKGDVEDIHGKKISATNAKDMEEFLSKQGATPTDGVFGVSGGDKGGKIKQHFVDVADPPEEVHFYDDLSKNTKDVESALAGKIPAELFVYGPGEFAHGQADANNPKDSFPAAEEKDKKKSSENSSRNREGQIMIERWQKLAGLIK